MQGLMMDYPLTLQHPFNRAIRLYAHKEIVTIGILFTLKGVHYRAFYRWLKGDWLHLFTQLPECTRRLALAGRI